MNSNLYEFLLNFKFLVGGFREGKAWGRREMVMMTTREDEVEATVVAFDD